MFKANRLYSVKNQGTGKLEWFFQAREGDFGPYETKDYASSMLKDYIEECIAQGNTGGRDKDGQAAKATTKFDLNQPPKSIIKYHGKKVWY